MPLRQLLLISLLLLAACGDGRLEQLDLSGGALGTSFNISIVEAPDDLDTAALEADVLATLERVDLLASTWREDSELSVFNTDRAIDWIIVSQPLCEALASALAIAEQTGGAFDVTIGPLVNLWGFGPDGLAVEPPSAEAITAAMQATGHDKIEVDCKERLVRKDHADMFVDLSGWAKGLAVDQLAELLDAAGLDNYLVEVGGELRAKGHNSEALKWSVAIEAPSTSRRAPHSIIRVTDASVATSGDYRNYFEHDGRRYSHTIDPRTGRPVAHNLAAVTVVHPSAAYADAMATALLVLGPEDGLALARELKLAAYLLVRNDAAIEELTTPEFDALNES
ncbi:MAG TPA: FAD:protein FMN transferase [Woeseiaceae bacterium]|jgi:thiamine biosynthesis lipoprotein|nr:FAD:protein FMN transferase [Woeseiaceae bacterium]